MHSGMEEWLCRMPEFKQINQINLKTINAIASPVAALPLPLDLSEDARFIALCKVSCSYILNNIAYFIYKTRACEYPAALTSALTLNSSITIDFANRLLEYL